MEEVVIASAARTAIGSFNGSLSGLAASDLGAFAITAACQRAGLDPAEVDETVMGQILTAACGQNPARQAAVAAGIPYEKTAYVINQLCGSGLRAVACALQAVRAGDARVVVAGGQESMSQAPHCGHLRQGTKLGDLQFTDSMISDGLWDAFHGYHMGVTAENVARGWQITRGEQDAFAAQSQAKTKAAQESGRFDEEIVPVTVRQRKSSHEVCKDEYPKPDTTVESLASLRPAFDREAGTVTPGNASGLNDGAAAVVVMAQSEARRRGITPLARIVSWATVGVDPAVMGTGPIPASKEALTRAGWSIADLDIIEANEAFAAQALAVNKEMGWPVARVNVNGGAVALGHPIGASGARILTTLLYEMRRRDVARGIATLCIGGGMGIAMCLSRA